MNDDDYQRIEAIKSEPPIDTSSPDWWKIILNKFLLPLIAVCLMALFIFQIVIFFVKGDGVVATEYFDRTITDAAAGAST